jgi:hypothetical protein
VIYYKSSSNNTSHKVQYINALFAVPPLQRLPVLRI